MHRRTACAVSQMENQLSVLGDGRRYRTELMVNPYSAPTSASTDRGVRHDESQRKTVVAAVTVLACVFACVATASTVWWAFQRVYNTVNPMYENTSLGTAIAMAFIATVLGAYIRFVQGVRGHRPSIISAVVAILAASLAIWSTLFIA